MRVAAHLGQPGGTLLKIGIVTPTYHPYPGGVPEHVYHTCVELGRLGHDVRVVTTSFGPGRAPNEVQAIRIGRSDPVRRTVPSVRSPLTCA